MVSPRGECQGPLGFSSVDAETTKTLLYVAGAVGIFVVMGDALRMKPLTLQEKWNFQETVELGTMNPAPVATGPGWPDLSEGSRTKSGSRE